MGYGGIGVRWETDDDYIDFFSRAEFRTHGIEGMDIDFVFSGAEESIGIEWVVIDWIFEYGGICRYGGEWRTGRPFLIVILRNELFDLF